MLSIMVYKKSSNYINSKIIIYISGFSFFLKKNLIKLDVLSYLKLFVLYRIVFLTGLSKM